MRARRIEHARDVQRSLIGAGVQCIVITTVDNAGITLDKIIPVGRLESVVARGVGISPVFDAFLVDDSTVPTSPLAVVHGDLRWLPDPFALRMLVLQPGWRWVLVDKYVPSGDVFGNCQRTFARTMEQRAAAEGLDVLDGLRDPALRRPRRRGGGSAHQGPAYSTTRFTQMASLIQDIMVALEAQGVGVDVMGPPSTARASSRCPCGLRRPLPPPTRRCWCARPSAPSSRTTGSACCSPPSSSSTTSATAWTCMYSPRDGRNLHAPGGTVLVHAS